ncbi:MAG: hypothetical protein R3247_03195 [Rhodothermales bacterium]|nr:hypothetical protein [Rhodothermales bacterium]
MFRDNRRLARFLFRLNVVPGALSLVFLLIPQPIVLAALAIGLALLYGYWRLSRGEATELLGLSERAFWMTSAGVNAAGGIAYVVSNLWQEGWLGAGVAVGIAWTVGTAVLSALAARRATSPAVSAGEAAGGHGP